MIYLSAHETQFVICALTIKSFLFAPCSFKANIQTGNDDDDDDDDDESISYVHPLLQLQTVTSVLMMHSDEQFSFQITMEYTRGWKVAAA